MRVVRRRLNARVKPNRHLKRVRLELGEQHFLLTPGEARQLADDLRDSACEAENGRPP